MFGLSKNKHPHFQNLYDDEDDYYSYHPQYPINRKQPKRIETMLRTLFYLLGSMLLGMIILQLL